MQLYSINILIESSSIATAYVLMNSRNKAAYVSVFAKITEYLDNISPISVVMDFEQGCID
jgi:hypothetical protein